jgi:hypothetical protein
MLLEPFDEFLDPGKFVSTGPDFSGRDEGDV